ncbi:Fe-S-containing protein [Campylobacter fetus]|uniref:Fe-S-containing protein n=1 Tax=Campylobacter fetus TaxID=196 RepID=UPI0008189A12|nr:Fe-S-containing protein [Campylobacter fetus]OCS00952.1 membrane protein [Campylobacter fetus subsp. testudinum]OCS02775.1 membrane protein [Campylobacter fetus subsp. testudinum]
MAIFFYQVVLALFGFSFIISFLDVKEHIKNIFLPAIVGIFVGFILFGITKFAIIADDVKLFFDTLCLAALVLFLFCFKFKNSYFISLVVFLLAVGYGFDYRYISMNFTIFAGDILDSLSLSNLFLICFALAILLLIYFILRSILSLVCRSVRLLFAVFSTVILIVDRAGFLTLGLMQNGTIPTYSNTLSIVAKIVYFDSFLPIVFSLFLAVLALFSLNRLPKKASYKDIIEFRITNAARMQGFRNAFFGWLLGAIIVFFSLFYILVSSRPPSISTPIIVEPINGEFKFDAAALLDGKLHRYAYITDDGHEVRFFLINRFKDKLAPVAVFDACAICGDMGYIKSGDNLICISCNVRIFLPSVGKAGGCNPIPFEYKYDGKNVTIGLQEIQKGATFFSKIVEKKVVDPVSKKEISNSSKFNYIYYGRTYFFENGDNQMLFEEKPEIYVTTSGELKE